MIFPIELINSVPDLLRNIPSPPTQLYCQGSPKARELLHQLPSQGLAIVGTRNPRERSTCWMKKQIQILGNFLKDQEPSKKLIILSGLARGIDTTAHLSALEANLPTIAIVGSGLDRCYPEINTQLRDRILEAGGLIISEFPPGSTLYRSHFLRRNRIIAGWARATWVVEAGYRSGALNTARWAREANRLCFATPCFPGDESLAGNQVLLDRDHALPYWGTHSLGAAWLELATCADSKTLIR